MTKLAFRSRFTEVEKAYIYLAAVHDPTANVIAQLRAASVRAFLDDVRDARYIQPDLPKTRASFEVLEQFGLIAVGRTAEILDAPIRDDEKPGLNDL